MSSSPGVSGIPTKVFKSAIDIFTPILTELFNKAILTKTIPVEWKSALVTPLFKSGTLNDLNNYRGISVLPPIAKVFEKIISSQIIIYFNCNKLFFNGQFGFREQHSCEAALHAIISKLNKSQSDKLISLLLFIDFRKVFDSVDTKLLLLKLKKYGFDTDSIDLISNYFTDRCQAVKFGGIVSDFRPINLGVGQGSVLGPLFFIIFINDSPFFSDTTLFADDAILYLQLIHS